MKTRQDLRNVAIVAHVDHGKTTLVDALFQQTGTFDVRQGAPTEQSLDSNELERERGITILAKCTSVRFKDVTINIVDTPGHADFGSEVERILTMVDGVLLLVDAADGPMPQTKYVLRKALAQDLTPIVVVNKMDRPNARPAQVTDEIYSLFIDLGAEDRHLDFPILYASGRQGWASLDPDASGGDMAPLFEAIVKSIPPPAADDSLPLKMMVTMTDYSSYHGSIGIGRIKDGRVEQGQTVALVKPDGTTALAKIARLEGFVGLERRLLQSARAGDIVALSGFGEIQVGDTVSDAESPSALPAFTMDAPTLSMEFMVNDSPFAGREGKFVTSRHLKARLEKERRTNVGLRVEELPGEGHFKISGRGELHLSILIETMRREGYELAVSRPEVIYKEEGGQVLEPAEALVLDVESLYQGAVMEAVGRRGAQMTNMQAEGQRLRLDYIITARALIGFKSEYLTLTRGNGVLHHSFHGYIPKAADITVRQNGVMVAKEPGRTTGYALHNLQDRAVMFLPPGVEVYPGMIVGQNSRGNDLVVNPCKQKQMSNMRSKASDEALILTPPTVFSLEQAIEFIDSDELVEVTPKSIRLRKKVLNASQRKRAQRDREAEAEEFE
ncbi:MAG TPA: translational GTPase TypA [Elusimicrobia bacterium]|nr:translational GTPase TypA [Elusimicrobiota bacterium]